MKTEYFIRALNGINCDGQIKEDSILIIDSEGNKLLDICNTTEYVIHSTFDPFYDKSFTERKMIMDLVNEYIATPIASRNGDKLKYRLFMPIIDKYLVVHTRHNDVQYDFNRIAGVRGLFNSGDIEELPIEFVMMLNNGVIIKEEI